MRISIEGYASEQQLLNAELSKNMDDKTDDKIKISEFKTQEILSNSTNSIKYELLELKNTIISKEELQKIEINKSIHLSNDQINQIIRGNEEKLSLVFSRNKKVFPLISFFWGVRLFFLPDFINH